MKIKVSTEGRTITVDMPKEKADQTFNEFVSLLLGINQINYENVFLTKPEETDREPEKEEIKSDTEYKGFLYLKCESCGQVKGFCTKGISEYTCTCGHVTPLNDLKPLHVNCQCGSNFKYMTNMEEEMFDIKCIDCGNPVSVSWHPKKKLYQTIK